MKRKGDEIVLVDNRSVKKFHEDVSKLTSVYGTHLGLHYKMQYNLEDFLGQFLRCEI